MRHLPQGRRFRKLTLRSTVQGVSTSRGFTLIEMVVVIVLSGIITVFVASRWSVDGMNVAAQATQLARDIEYTQALAMSSHTRWCRINFSTSRYSISNISNTQRPPLWPHAIVPGAGITLTANRRFITFNGLGVPYGDVSFSVPLRTSTTITLTTTSGATKTITVLPETGTVSVS